MTDRGWERGDLLGVDFPVHLEALRAGGAGFLTGAFRAAGSLGEGNRVVAVTGLEPVSGGSTGRKAALSVAYEHDEPGLPTELFVKFSRDLDDELRDRGKRQMGSEVRFGLLSHLPDFPVAVPRCLFGEYRAESGSGVLVSARIAFGAGDVEPHHPKGRDHELDDALGHYEALLSAMARLAGAHRSGRFPDDVMAAFAPDPARRTAFPRQPYTPQQIRNRVARYADFAARHPQLLPEAVRSEAFLAGLAEDAPRAVEHADAIRAARKAGSADLVAFCHWNANVDNAWFWRDGDGRLACGLLDWGNVGQMDLVTAIASCLTFAEPDFLVEHLDHLLGHFAAELEGAGGGRIEPALLHRQYALHGIAGGLQHTLDAVPLLERHVPDLATVVDRFDPRILDDEFARTQLLLLTVSLVRWQAVGAGALLDELLAE